MVNIGQIIAGAAAVLVAAEGVYSFVADNDENLLRPPGIQGERDFMSRCIKCGKCIEACPHVAIRAAGAGNGAAVSTPVILPRTQACMLCEDFPCVNACPTEALRNVESRTDVNMGYAVIDENLCIAFSGMRCEVCYRVCPFIDEAITLKFEQIKGDSIHAKFQPVIHKGKCVGCGLCVQRCVVDTPRVAIRIKTIAEMESDGESIHDGSGSGNGSGNGNGSGSGNGLGNGNGSGSGSGNGSGKNAKA